MAVNGYFNNFPSQQRISNEHLLMEDVIVESIQIMGHNVYYIPRESFDAGDMVFGEYSKSKFSKAYTIEAYIANVEGFEGDGDFFSKFGLEIRDTSNFVLSRRSFKKVVPSTIRQRPQEGDLVFIPVMNRMFEIKFIEEEVMFFSLGKKLPYVYEMRCELFRYSMDEISTGVDKVDAVAEENSYTIKMITGNGVGSFNSGEIVYQSSDSTWANTFASATVKQWYEANSTLYVYNIEGQFEANTYIRGNTSNATYLVTSLNDWSDFVDRDLYDNQEFKNDGSDILDLTEVNPFGVP